MISAPACRQTGSRKMNMKNKKLHNIKSSGFKAPDGYLESFDELLFNKLKESSPLYGLENSGFIAPENYFESFEEKFAKTLTSEKEIKVIPFIPWKKMLYVSGIAASIILMVNLFNNDYNKPTFENLETALIDDYIVEEDFTNEDIASLVTEDLTLDKFMDSHLIDADLEEYILNNSSVEEYLKEENK